MATGGVVVVVVVAVVIIRMLVDDDDIVVAGRFAGAVDGKIFLSISNGIISVVAVDDVIMILVVDVHVVGRSMRSRREVGG